MIYIPSGGEGVGGVLTINAENGSIISISQEDVVKSQIANNGKVIFKGVTSGFWNLESHLNDKFYEKQIEININKIVNVNYFEATINVTFPTDCTSVTCSKGDKSYSVPSGSLSSGSYVFNVYEMGEWTIYCTNGEKEKSSIVNITESRAYTVDIKFTLVLYDSGSEYPESTGEWSVTSSSGQYAHACEITKNSSNMVFFAGYHSTASFSHSQPIDMSKYATLHILGKFDNKSTGESGTVGVSTSNSGEEFNASVSMSGIDSGNVQRDVDLSNVNTNAYFKIYMENTCQFTASKIWLE